MGESVILTELLGKAGQTLSIWIPPAQAGVLYTYRIIPIHEELLQQGVWLEGEQAVQLAQVQTGGVLFRAAKPHSCFFRFDSVTDAFYSVSADHRLWLFIAKESARTGVINRYGG